MNEEIIHIAQSCKAYKQYRSNHKSQKSKNRPPRKPWEDEEFCRVRREYRSHKNKLKRVGLKQVCNRKAKEFKKFGKDKQKQYFDSLHSKIRHLKKNNSKEYWLLLQKSTEGQRIASKITLHIFLDHFKQLNKKSNEKQTTCSPCQESVDDDNEILNINFSILEIQTIIRKLKNNKSPGLDLMRNEFLKNASFELISFICRLFNFILNSGYVPDIWCKGLIMPLYKNKGDSSDPDNYRGI